MNSYIVTLGGSDASPSVCADHDPGVVHALFANEPSTCISGSAVMPTIEQVTAAVLRPTSVPALAQRVVVPLPAPVAVGNTCQQRTRQQTAQGAPQHAAKNHVVRGGVQWA